MSYLQLHVDKSCCSEALTVTLLVHAADACLLNVQMCNPVVPEYVCTNRSPRLCQHAGVH